MNDDQKFRQRAWYFTHIFADPKDQDTLYSLNTDACKSTDGGKSFTSIGAPHGDNHGLWIDPENPRHVIIGNDGGASVTLDGGRNWSTQNNQPTAQFYHVAADNRTPYYLFGAQQDNSPVAIKSWSDSGQLDLRSWYEVGGSESSTLAPDPRDGNIVYCAGQGYSRFDKSNETGQDISPYPVNNAGHGAADFEHRIQWTEPIFISPHDPNTIYTAAEVVFRSDDQGRNWKTVSPDLTRNDKSKQVSSGGPITKDNTTVEYYDTVFALAESPLKKGVLWAGTDDGLVQVTQNGGGSWQNVTPKAMPEWGTVDEVEPSPFEDGGAIVSVDRHKLDDIHPYIFKTSDFGKTWTAITSNIPEGAFVHVVREDPKRKGLLYAGTEKGVYVSLDGGVKWSKLQLNLPTTPIHDLRVKDGDLLVATHGRSFWILDDLSPLRQWSGADEAFHLYKPRTSARTRLGDTASPSLIAGENPPGGAVMYYRLAKEPKDPIKLEILDSSGKLVRTYTSPSKDGGDSGTPGKAVPQATLPVEVGLNRFSWDMRRESPVPLAGSVYEGSAAVGPIMPPGHYQVRLTVGKDSQVQEFDFTRDPRCKSSDAELLAQYKLAGDVDELVTALHRGIIQIRELRTQIDAVTARYGEDKKWAPMKKSATAIRAKLQTIEDSLVQSKIKSDESDLNYPVMLEEQIWALDGDVDADFAPTAAQKQLYDSLKEKVDAQLRRWKELLAADLNQLNRDAATSGIPLFDPRLP